MDTGPEAITEADVLTAVRRQARRVHRNAALAALALTALYLIVS